MTCKVCIILWKDLLRRKNRYILTTVEIFVPIFLIIIANVSVPSSADEREGRRLAKVTSFTFEPFTLKQCIPKYSIYGKIIYEPSTPLTDTLVSRAACYAGYTRSGVKPGNLNNISSFFSIGVKFDNDFAEGKTGVLNYTLFPTNKAWHRMNYLWRVYRFAMPRYSVPAIHNVVELQRAIDASYLHSKNVHAPEISFEGLDLNEMSLSHFSIIVHLILFMAITLVVPPIVSKTVQEKFTGAKELMLTMGLTRRQLWAAKFLEAFLFAFITFGGMVLFLYVPLKEDSNYLEIPVFIFFGVLLYGLIGIILFLFFVSCVFDTPTVAVYLTELFWCLTFVFKNILSNYFEIPVFVNYLLCLFPHVSFMAGADILLRYHDYGKDVKLLENLTGKDGSPCLLHILLIMTINIVIYLILTWYLEQVKPGRYGLAREPTFCFKKYYWFPKKCLPSYGVPRKPVNDDFEVIEDELTPGVEVKGVTKTYKSSDNSFITAVENVHLSFYQGEINGVLGHNGAGKTTLFSMITGMTRPSVGRVFINGFDLSINTCEARRSIGLCPQEDKLFNDLTALETLKFYGVVKGLSLAAAKKEALDLIKKLHLGSVKHTLARNLSGGQKRKVSLAIALIGGSEVLVLDEPTSGMDTETRREIWEFLLELRLSRTIILTTHFMEEADFLCDRIAILDHGKVKCHGTPRFLKSRFGKGYILKVVVNEGDPTNQVESYVTEHIPNAKYQCESGRTVAFELPENETSSFPQLLTYLEKKRTEKKIKSYCLNSSTLEDAFLRLRMGEEEMDLDEIDSRDYRKALKPGNIKAPRVSGCLLLAYQFWALLHKKWIFLRRCYKMFLLFSIVPALVVIFMNVFLELNKNRQKVTLGYHTQLPYSLELYNQSLVLYSGLKGSDRVALFRDLVQSFDNRVEEVDDIERAVEEIFDRDFYTYARKLNFGVDFSHTSLTVFQNDHGVHMIPVSLNFIHNFLLKSQKKDDAIVTSVDNRFSNRELLLIHGDRVRRVSWCRISEFSEITGALSMFFLLGPLRESFHGAKEIQLMMTVSPLYWFSHLLFDALIFFAYITTLYFGLGLSLHDTSMIESAGEILTALFLWGCGLILFSYVITILKKDTAVAFSLNVVCYFISSFISANLVTMQFLPYFFQYLHPSSILIVGFSNYCAGKRTFFIWALFFYDLALFTYLTVVDWGFLGRAFHSVLNKLFKVDYSISEAMDEDVKKEEQKVRTLIKEQEASRSTLLVNELRRWYFRRFRPFPAVRGVSFSVNKGECFGLLGVNGAGKTSTFRMLAGRLPPSQGSTYIFSKPMTGWSQKRLFSIGYCPQGGGLIPVFTGRELLTYFARLRGLRKHWVRREVEYLLEKLDLLEHAEKACGNYSGGNKRKLSTAVAVLGDCPLIFLDEPTSGVDPMSRRLIWKVIEEVQGDSRSVVLTSHSMDECEALCSRLAIMMNGRFCCIGETTSLKDKYGLGYHIHLKVSNKASQEEVLRLKKEMTEKFGPCCKLVDRHLTSLQYQVLNEDLSWCDLFYNLNDLKANFNILESYTASATTLEQIFIHLARNRLRLEDV